MQGSRDQQGKIRKPSKVNNTKKLRKTIEWERLEISSRKLKVPRDTSCKDGDSRGLKQQGPNRAEEIKKRWQEYRELHKKDLNNLNNHDDVVTPLEPDILECEVK